MPEAKKVEDQNTGEDTQESQESHEKFYLGDKEFDTVEDAASYAKDLERRLQENEAALNYVQNAYVPRQDPPSTPTPQPEDTGFSVDESEFFQRPGEVLSKFEQRINDTIQKQIGSIRTEYNNDQQRREYWNTFYAENPQLRGFESVVEQTLTENGGKWGSLPLHDSRKVLADATSKKLLSIAEKFSPGGDVKKTDLITPGGKGTKVKEEKPKEEKVTTLSEVIRQRRHKRMTGNIS